MGVFGIRFECSMEQYLSIPSGNLAFEEGLRFSYNKDNQEAVIRSFCDTDIGDEKVVSFDTGRPIMEHVVKFKLK